MNRRTVLAAGTSVAALSLAGCLGDDGGSQLELEPWLPSPSLFGRDGYPSPFQYYDYPSLTDETNGFADTLLEETAFGQTDPVFYMGGLVETEMDLRITSPQLFGVVQGDIDPDELGTQLEDEGFTQEDESGDATIYRVEDDLGNPGAIGVADGVAVRVGHGTVQNDTVLLAGRADNPVERVADIFAANGDESMRFAAKNEHVGALIPEMGTSDVGFGEWRRVESTSVPSGRFRGQRAWGAEFTIDGETTNFNEIFVFAPDTEPPEGDMEDWLATNDPHEWSREELNPEGEISVEENIAIVSGEFDTAEGFQVL